MCTLCAHGSHRRQMDKNQTNNTQRTTKSKKQTRTTQPRSNHTIPNKQIPTQQNKKNMKVNTEIMLAAIYYIFGFLVGHYSAKNNNKKE